MNGIIYLVRTPGENPKKIHHVTDLKKLYPDFDFDLSDDSESENEENDDDDDDEEDF